MVKTLQLGIHLLLFLERVSICEPVLLFLHASGEIWSFNVCLYLQFCQSDLLSSIGVSYACCKKQMVNWLSPQPRSCLKPIVVANPFGPLCFFFLVTLHALYDFNLSTDFLMFNHGHSQVIRRNMRNLLIM